MIIQHAITTAALSTAASSSQTCDDIHNCRTLSSIVYNCFSTIFLCTWVALHLDVPKDPWKLWWKRFMDRISWTLIALLAPEIVLFDALEKWMDCCFYLEQKLKADPTCNWTETHAMLARMGGLQLVKEYGSNMKRVEKDLSKVPSDVNMPKPEEIQDRGKGDNIIKAIAVIQTLWFAIQAAHRMYKGLVVTVLELTVFGHVLLNIFTYWCWWNKPLSIRFPIAVYPTKKKNRQDKPADGKLMHPRLSMRVRLGAYLHRQDTRDNLPQNVSSLAFVGFFVGYSMIGGVFGAIHCLAWNSTFPLHIEQTLWRVSALVVTAIPILLIAIEGLLKTLRMLKMMKALNAFYDSVLAVVCFIYVIARVCLLVLSLIALRDLPYRAYETPSWTAFIPHIG